MKKDKETKRDRFVRLAEARVNSLFKTLQLIGNLSRKENYEYTSEDVERIFGAIEAEVAAAKKRFVGDANEKKPFTLKETVADEDPAEDTDAEGLAEREDKK